MLSSTKNIFKIAEIQNSINNAFGCLHLQTVETCLNSIKRISQTLDFQSNCLENTVSSLSNIKSILETVDSSILETVGGDSKHYAYGYLRQ